MGLTLHPQRQETEMRKTQPAAEQPQDKNLAKQPENKIQPAAEQPQDEVSPDGVSLVKVKAPAGVCSAGKQIIPKSGIIEVEAPLAEQLIHRHGFKAVR